MPNLPKDDRSNVSKAFPSTKNKNSKNMAKTTNTKNKKQEKKLNLELKLKDKRQRSITNFKSIHLHKIQQNRTKKSKIKQN